MAAPLPSPTPTQTTTHSSFRTRASNTSLRSASLSSASGPLSSLRVKPKSKPKRTGIIDEECAATRFDQGIQALRYEETTQAKPPIPVTVPPPRAPPTEEHPAFRRGFGVSLTEEELRKRDSGLAPTTNSGSSTYRHGGRSFREGEGSIMTVEEDGELGVGAKVEAVLGVEIDFDTTATTSNMIKSAEAKTEKPKSSSSSTASSAKGAQIEKVESAGSGSTSRKLRKKKSMEPSPETTVVQEFKPIETDIPTESLMSEDFMGAITFSHRGSVMLGGKKAVRPSGAVENGHARLNGGRRQPSISMLAQPSDRFLSAELEMESQKVRSMYEQGDPFEWEHLGGDRGSSTANVQANLNLTDVLPRPATAISERRDHELAGGIEDWEDVDGLDVDRYGFISKQRPNSKGGTPEPRPPQRVSTMLQLASEAPRKTRGFGRAPSNANSSPFKRDPSRKVSSRSLRTTASNSSQRSSSRIRAAANRLPGNKDRRWMDEAGDMLTLPPGLADIAEDEEGGRAAEAMKKKEAERTEKWRKMAKVKSGKDGEGMEFEFDTKNSKLIERTWKGIPDRWRAAAWYSFLSTSAKKHKDSASEAEIIQAFHQHLAEASADDVQIDIDVPRTINSHIMFRRRYRGGQRLLFRVLHALSLYFPQTGYVQGMASLAATLLCYFDEEKAFVMLVRMWTLRGLSKLYESGFLGLMAALNEFQSQWLSSRDVSLKLNELNIEPTAYGTRWYLTLFNYSIPFPAQLRVWDVFLLLGDPDPSLPATTERPFAGGLDVLHATAAALIDATREILLDSDFENAMKVLTSWVPVKDEELLMKVARAEWRGAGGRRRRK